MAERQPVALGPRALDVLMPMHMVVGPNGHVEHIGPTLGRLRPPSEILGRRLLEVFQLRHPDLVDGRMARFRKLAGRGVQLQFRDAPRTVLKAIAVSTESDRRLVLNTSFGISAIPAVRDYALTNSDFAPTDLTIELLYLNEAKTAVVGEFQRVNAELQIARNIAQAQALTDTLTGLSNRRGMDRTAADLIATKRAFALIHLDLDYFKQVNDSLGHAAGDAVLSAVASRLLKILRGSDTAGRVGGDEFLILVDGEVPETRMQVICEKVIEELERPIEFEGQECRISGSIGYTLSRYYAEPAIGTMIADADDALYRAKKAGRGRAQGFVPQEGSDFSGAA